MDKYTDASETKTCFRCKLDVPIGGFYRAGKTLKSWCKKCCLVYNMERRRLDRDRTNEINRRSYYNNPEKNGKRARDKQRRLRLAAFSVYGSECACCSESRYEFLAIDHIDGGGGVQRRSGDTNIYSWLKKNNYPSGFRTLCHNCNMALGCYGVCPHDR